MASSRSSSSRVDVLDLGRGAPEGLGLVSGFAASYEELGDALERLDGFHEKERTLFVVPFYTEQVVPRLTNVLLGSHAFGTVRAQTCAGLHGDVIELGFGSGLNLAYLPDAVSGLWAVEPSGVGMKLAAKRIAASPVPVHPAGLDGARIDLPDDRFDCALSTMTLCTIPDVDAALRELHRVLKPGGTFHFAEHGRAPDPKVARTQDRFTGLQQRLAGGCHLERDIPALLAHAGFAITELDNSFLKGGPKAWSYMFIGRADAVASTGSA